MVVSAWGSWLLLLGLSLALFALAMTWDRGRSAGLGPEARTDLLMSASLVHERDLVFGPEDRDRALQWWDGGGAPLVRPGDSLRFARPLPYALALAPWAWLLPEKGAVLAQTLYLLAAALILALALKRQLGNESATWVALALFGSAAYSSVFVAGEGAFLLAVSLAAFGLVVRSEPPSLAELKDVADRRTPRGRLALWVSVGVLLGCAAAHQLFAVLLLLPAAAALPRGWKARGVAVLVGSTGLVVLASALLGAPPPGFDNLASVTEAFRPGSDLAGRGRLLGWQTVDFLIGRRVGVVPYFLPVLALFALGGRRWRLLVGPIAALALVGTFWVRPHDLGGADLSLGSVLFLPFYGALMASVARIPATRWLVLLVVLAAPLLWPLWWSPRVRPVAPSQLAAKILPPETTDREGPPRPHTSLGSVQVWGVGRYVVPGHARNGLALMGGATGELLVASPEELASLDLTFGRDAASELQVSGGELQENVLRPDGSIRFRIALESPSRMHTVFWAQREEVFYRLRLTLPGASARPYDFRLGARFQTGAGE